MAMYKFLSQFPILCLVLTWTTAAQAHDFWVQPESYHPAQTSRLKVTAYVGESFRGEALARDPSHIDAFRLHCADHTSDIVGLDGQVPTGYVALSQPGLCALQYVSRPVYHEMSYSQFVRYLDEVNQLDLLDTDSFVVEDQTVSEIFIRCAKSIIHVGEVSGPQDRPVEVGMPLELTWVAPPETTQSMSGYRVQLKYQNTPLAGIMVKARGRSNPEEVLQSQTDKDGLAVFELGSSDEWIFTAVYITPSSDYQISDWISYWASLTLKN